MRKLLPIRRWGVAVLSGITLLGALTVLGEGVASAATTVTVASAGTTVVFPSAKSTAIANVTLTENTAGAVAAEYVCLQPSAGDFNFGGIGAAYTIPTVTAPAGVSIATQTGGTLSSSATGYSASPTTSTINNGDYYFQVTPTASSTAGTYTISGLFVDPLLAPDGVTPAAAKAQVTVSVGFSLVGPTAACIAAAAAGATTPPTSEAPFKGAPVIYGAEEATAAIYGTSADQTTAAEFTASFACTQHNAVLATDADPYDALSAATLEGTLATGLLITQPTALDPSTLQALALDGITTIYVVGGSSAISAADITALKATPATNCGGTPTGANITVKGPFFGATADDTAVAIVTEAASLPGWTDTGLPSLTSVSSNTYNDVSANTAGNGSTAGLASPAPSAILVSDAEAQDAASISPVAYQYKLPVLLTGPSALGTQASAELSSLGITQVIIVGGPLAVAPAVVTTLIANGYTVIRIAGKDGSDSSSQLAAFETTASPAGLGWLSTSIYLAQPGATTGSGPSDALGAASLAGKVSVSAPLILTEAPGTGLGTAVPAELGILGAKVWAVNPLGGPLALPTSTITASLTALAV